MDFMVKYNFVELNPPFQESLVMAASHKTVFITNFCPWFGFDIEFSPVAAHHDQTFDFFPQFGPDPSAGWVVTDTAFKLAVGRGFPALEEGLHIVTGSTESGMGGVLDGSDGKHQKKSSDSS